QKEEDTSSRTRGERLNYASLEPENRDQRRDRQTDRPGIEARQYRHIEGEAVAAQRDGFTKPGVQCEPDRQIEDDPDYSGGDAGECAVERLVAAQYFDTVRT